MQRRRLSRFVPFVLCAAAALALLWSVAASLESSGRTRRMMSEVDFVRVELDSHRRAVRALTAEVARLLVEVESLKGETLPALREQVGDPDVYPYIGR